MTPPQASHARAGRFSPDSPVEIAPLPLGRRIAALAARQHGVITARQLAALGLAQQTLSDHVREGRLHRLHRGVYAVGHTVLTTRGHWMAAVLAAGPGAALSHASAAALWDLRRSAATVVDVSVPGRAGRMKRRGLRIHRPRTLRPTEVTSPQGIPVTPPARTILDLAATLQPHRLERLLDQAEILELTDPQAQRPRTALPRDLRQARPAGPAGQPPGRRRRGRLPLRRAAPRRRDRQLAVPQDPPG